MGNPITCVYQFIYDEKGSVDTDIIQCFIMHRLVFCIKVDSYVAHMFYAWAFSHNTGVPISIEKNKYFLSLNTYTTVLTWGYGNLKKNKT